MRKRYRATGPDFLGGRVLIGGFKTQLEAKEAKSRWSQDNNYIDSVMLNTMDVDIIIENYLYYEDGEVRSKINTNSFREGCDIGHTAPNGYGRVRFCGKQHYIHRLVWRICYGM